MLKVKVLSMKDKKRFEKALQKTINELGPVSFSAQYRNVIDADGKVIHSVCLICEELAGKIAPPTKGE